MIKDECSCTDRGIVTCQYEDRMFPEFCLSEKLKDETVSRVMTA